MPLLQTDETALHYEVYGEGSPVTLFAHGVASSIEDVRFLASGVRGSRVFLHFRGHGRSGAPEGDSAWGYAAATRDLRAVADHVGASACVGVSMGAGAILGCLAGTPDRLDRVVLVLPAALDRPRSPRELGEVLETAELIDAGDVAALTALLAAQLPADVAAMRGIDAVIRRRAADMCRPGVARALRALPGSAPVRDRGVLRDVTAQSLVIAHEGDATHPAALAREIAGALPGAELHVFDRPWSMLRERAVLRGLVAGFLSR
ncbi:MAG TPA: alpha/beta hydrolase [Mycobacteriales bacterium]|nr:alpha/beta hydrolase [Mycobacteriales bacterium]